MRAICSTLQAISTFASSRLCTLNRRFSLCHFALNIFPKKTLSAFGKFSRVCALLYHGWHYLYAGLAKPTRHCQQRNAYRVSALISEKIARGMIHFSARITGALCSYNPIDESDAKLPQFFSSLNTLPRRTAIPWRFMRFVTDQDALLWIAIIVPC